MPGNRPSKSVVQQVLSLTVAAASLSALTLSASCGQTPDAPQSMLTSTARSTAGSKVPRPTAPPGMSLIELPPRKIDVPPGADQPIATKYGLTYEIPPDWKNEYSAVTGWESDRGEISRYSTTGSFGAGYCPEEKLDGLAVTGATGRNGVDLDTAARDHVHLAERVFASSGERFKPKVEYVGPKQITVAGRPAVRYTAIVTDVPKDGKCKPPAGLFDIVATPSYATAEVMILMVELHQGLPGSLGPDVADRIIASLRPSEGYGG